LLAGGLYSVLWGKSKEANIDPCSQVNKIGDPQDLVEIDIYVKTKNKQGDEEEAATTSAPRYHAS